MKTTTNPGSDPGELAHGRLPACPDLDSLADLLTAYRSAAIGPAPRPSAALSARVDLTVTPLAMQGNVIASGVHTNDATRRAVTGLFGLGVTVAIILGAAGAAAAVSMGTGGLFPPGAQDVFDQVVSDHAPLREGRGVPAVVTPTPAPTGNAPASDGSSDDEGEDADSRHERGTGNSGHNNGVGSSGEDNGFGNSGKHSGTSSDDDSDERDDDSDDIDSDESDDSDMSTGESHVKNGGSGENNGGGNSSKDDD